jgi:hypothetical protein
MRERTKKTPFLRQYNRVKKINLAEVFALLGGRGSPSPVNGAGLFSFCKKGKSAKLRMSLAGSYNPVP